VYDYAAEPVDRQQQQICACPGGKRNQKFITKAFKFFVVFL
jgi:hypothetical protein